MNDYLIKKIKEGRINAGLKQSDVATLLGLKANTLSNYENGVSEPDIDTFCTLCDIYSLDPAELLSEAYGLSIQGCSFSIKPSEIEYIKKYRALDAHGKDMVDVVLDKEYDRCSSVDNHILIRAAHERTDIEVTDDMRKHDDDIMNDENF